MDAYWIDEAVQSHRNQCLCGTSLYPDRVMRKPPGDVQNFPVRALEQRHRAGVGKDALARKGVALAERSSPTRSAGSMPESLVCGSQLRVRFLQCRVLSTQYCRQDWRRYPSTKTVSGFAIENLLEAGMKFDQLVHAAGAFVTTAILAGMLSGSPSAQAADSDADVTDPRVQRGLEIAPVPLNLAGKDRALVGLGSYLVNVTSACNDCHTASQQTKFAPGGNPYFGQPAVVNQSTYLGGGQDFGPLIPGTPDIVSRNLTPDKTGRPAGGRSFAEFREIIRTGVDLDHLHPPCSAAIATGCLPAPFDGNLLQIMPWPAFQNFTDYDLRAIYEYLSTIPCIAGPPAPSVLHNDCS